MKKILLVTFLLMFSLFVFSMDNYEYYSNLETLDCSQFQNGTTKVFEKVSRFFPNYNLKHTYVLEKNYYFFNKQGKIIEANKYGGNDSYRGYYIYDYSDSLEVRAFYSTHNEITEKYINKKLDSYNNVDMIKFGWGGTISERITTRLNIDKNIRAKKHYNEAGYLYMEELEYHNKQNMIDSVITLNSQYEPVATEKYIYDKLHKRVNSRRIVNANDSLLFVIEYEYDRKNRWIQRTKVNFRKGVAFIVYRKYDPIDRLASEIVHIKTDLFGGSETPYMKKEYYYENYPVPDFEIYKGQDVRDNLKLALTEREEEAFRQLAKMKKENDLKNERIMKERAIEKMKKRRYIEERKARN